MPTDGWPEAHTAPPPRKPAPHLRTSQQQFAASNQPLHLKLESAQSSGVGTKWYSRAPLSSGRQGLPLCGAIQVMFFSSNNGTNRRLRGAAV